MRRVEFEVENHPEEAENRLVDHLRLVVIRLSRHLRRESQAAGLSVLDTQVLSDIYRIPDIGISELAAIELVSAPAMSLRIKRLLDLGWLNAEPGPEDSRRVGLRLTAKGLRAFDHIKALHNGWLEKHLIGLSESEIATLNAAILPLTKVLEHASQEGRGEATARELEAINRVRGSRGRGSAQKGLSRKK